MVIQLTKGELAILEQAALGRGPWRVNEEASTDPDLALLLDMQLVTNAEGRLQLTPMGQRVLKMVRGDPRRG